MEFTIESIPNVEFRIKKMNALETLAMQNVMKFSDMDSTLKTYMTIMEYIEVKVNDKWIDVYNKKTGEMLPVSLNENIAQVNDLITFFLKEYLIPVFRKSNESKVAQE